MKIWEGTITPGTWSKKKSALNGFLMSMLRNVSSDATTSTLFVGATTAESVETSSEALAARNMTLRQASKMKESKSAIFALAINNTEKKRRP